MSEVKLLISATLSHTNYTSYCAHVAAASSCYMSVTPQPFTDTLMQRLLLKLVCVVPGGNCQIWLFANVAFLIVEVNEAAAALRNESIASY